MTEREQPAGDFGPHIGQNAPNPRCHLLLVAYFYPPSADTGARRPATMAKYLRRLGHRVTVLTTSAFGTTVGPEEPEIIRAADAQRWRARLHGHDRIDSMFDSDTYSGSPHPLSKLLVPEPLVAAWMPFARSAALRRHRRDPFDAVITTSPPESAHAIGRALARRGVPWVADVRDAWTFEPLRPPFPTALQRRLDERLERRWLGSADAVVCVSRPAAEDLSTRLGIDSVLVRNGWDPDDEPDAVDAASDPLIDPERRSLVYTGRFGSYGRDPRPLVQALEALARDEPQLAETVELVIAGPLTEDERKLFADANVDPARIVLAGSVGPERARKLQRAADALLLIASSRRSQLANFKLFEYLSARAPIVALAEGTEAGRIVSEAGGEVVASDEVAEIVALLARLATGGLEPPRKDAVNAHSYPAAAELMAATVQAAIEARRRAA